MEKNDQKLKQLMKELFARKEYERLVYLCRSVSPENPNYLTARVFEKKARFMLGNHDVKWALAFVCVALTILLSGMIFMNKKIDREFSLKEMQVNSLIDEVGAVKEENDILLSQIGRKENYLQDSLKIINEVDAKLTELMGKDGDVLKIQMNKLKSAVNNDNKSGEEKGLLLGIDPEYEGRQIQTYLILGTHGNLTDTILIAIVNRANQSVSLVSIPRDLYIQGRKINSVYKLFGAPKIGDYLQDITGLPLNQYLVINLQGFIEFVDLFGGIDIYNEKAIYDTLYPGPNYTYSTFSLEAGDHHLDGGTALKFARSRKSSSDFDRAKRQQQVIEAILKKVKEYDFVANIYRVQEIFEVLAANIDTNIAINEAVGSLNEFKSFNLERGNVLDTSNYLYSTRDVQGQYILLPNKKDYSEIRAFIKELVLN